MLFFVLNVKNDRLDATLIIIIILAEYTGVIFTLTSGKHDFMIVILTLFLKYYDVNYLVIYLRRINLIKRALAAWYLKKQKLEFNKNNMFQSYF